MRRYFVYILASRSRCLYVGVTNDIRRRVAAHRAGLVAFTARYRVRRLVYVEETTDIRAALAREKQIKGWIRVKKEALIETDNSDWRDLLEEEQEGEPSLRSG